MNPAETFTRMPKTEVHLHLEGTISAETLWAMASHNRVALPVGSLAELKTLYTFESFDKFIDLWLAMCRCLRTPSDYERMVDGFLAECARQGIRYAEVHFTPYNHEKFGIGGRRALDVVTRRLATAEGFSRSCTSPARRLARWRSISSSGKLGFKTTSESRFKAFEKFLVRD